MEVKKTRWTHRALLLSGNKTFIEKMTATLVLAVPDCGKALSDDLILKPTGMIPHPGVPPLLMPYLQKSASCCLSMFVLDVPPYLLIKSGKMSNIGCFQRELEIKDVVAASLNMGQATDL